VTGFDHIHHDMRITYTLSASVLPIALLAACSTPEPAPTPAPTPPATTVRPVMVAPPPAQPQGKWVDWPISPGDWVYRQDERGSIALFGKPSDDATIVIRCDKARDQIFLSRIGQVSANGANMTLRASSGLKSYPVGGTGNPPYYAAIQMAPDDYMLDRIAFSRGRFAVEVSGMRSLAIPIWPEFTRVVEDCRN